MNNKNLLVYLNVFFFFFPFPLKFFYFAPTVSKKNTGKSILMQNIFCQNQYVTKAGLEDIAHWSWRVQTEELPQRDLSSVYKYVHHNRVTQGRTSFIMSEDRRTRNDDLQLKKTKNKNVLPVIWKVLKTKVNCFDSLADEPTAVIAADS